MTESFLDLFPVVGDIWRVISDSALFTVLKWFLMVYTVVLICDLIFLIKTRSVTADVKTALYGTERPLVTKAAMQKRWDTIMARLRTHNPSQYKVAILEADQMADELLEGIGYIGANMGERLESVHLGQLESFESLKLAHEIRNRIVNEKDFQISQAEARRNLDNYRTFFVELELF